MSSDKGHIAGRSRYRWRGDILRALWHKDSGALQAAPADALGFDWQPQKSEAPKQEQAPSQEKTTLELPAPQRQIISEQPRPKLAFVCHVSSEFHSPVPLQKAYTPGAKPDINELIPQHPGELSLQPLARWSSLWPWLHEVLGHKVKGRKVDMPALMRQVLRLQALQSLPRESLRRWADGAIFILDFSQRLLPLRRDMQGVMRQLLRERGNNGLDCWVVEQGPYSDYHDFFGRRQYQAQAPGLGSKPLVICSDLGAYESSAYYHRAHESSGVRDSKDNLGGLAHAWREYGAWFTRQFNQRPWVLCPCPPDLWQREVTQYFHMVYWDRHSKISTQVKAVPNTAPVSERETAMLSRAATAVRVEPHLLRALRLQAQPALDVGHEIAAWQSPLVRQTPRGFAFTEQALAHFEKPFRALSPAEQRRIAELVQQAHGYLHSDVRLEEALHHKLLTHSEQATKIFDYLLHEKGGAKPSDPVGSPETQAWLARLCHRLPLAGRSAQAYQQLCDSLAEQRDQQGQADLPEGLDHRAWYARNAQGEKQILAVRGLAQGQLILQSYAADAELPEDCLASLAIRDKQVLVYQGLDGKNLTAGPQVLKLSEPAFVNAGNTTEAENNPVILGSDSETLTLQEINRPGWAKSLSRCDGELIAEYLPQQNSNIISGEKAYWCPPGAYPLLPSQETFQIEKGFFWHQKNYQAFKQVGGFVKPEWAEAFGVDKYGIYADLKMDSLTQRFRWICPGTFLMGSPESEAERKENETQHAVTLTKDYWLAETACSQGFWQAVMGNNPSRFKKDKQSKHLPVEQVSWDACQAMIRKLNHRLPSLQARLPSEAEWEFACRAGSASPFSFGEELTTDLANYDGKHPYNHQAKGVYRERTLTVDWFAPNSWGLYQMHGNVREWCEDWRGEYPQAEVTDPTGPEHGSVRVLRGGSWDDSGWWLRSAHRLAFVPDLDYVSSGLRLALG